MANISISLNRILSVIPLILTFKLVACNIEKDIENNGNTYPLSDNFKLPSVFIVSTPAFQLLGLPVCECRFNFSYADGRKRVYRRRVERFADACIIERNRFGGGSVLVWDGIRGSNESRLIFINGNMNAQTYINDVLDLVPAVSGQLPPPTTAPWTTPPCKFPPRQ